MKNDAVGLSAVMSIVEELRGDAIRQRAVIEGTFKTTLQPKDRTSAFEIWGGGPVTFRGIDLKSLEWRNPVVADGATAGPALIVEMGTDVCISPKDLRSAYPEHKLTGIPRGNSLSEETVWSVDLGPGNLVSFGFPESRRECMSGLTLRLASPA
ncbi:hypothetical protein [Paracoccus sp. (in: a-proteobacteria)]|uniref:hypothetical protein n=1 Tax=Paracoccus sp. TaxID=267 RepID=UPI003A876017